MLHHWGRGVGGEGVVVVGGGGGIVVISVGRVSEVR